MTGARVGSLAAVATPEMIEALRRHAEPLPDPDGAEFGARFDRFGDARVVLLGESTHGTSEFYRARAAITRRLLSAMKCLNAASS